MNYCTHCGAVLEDGAVSVCPECGKALTEQIGAEETEDQTGKAKKRHRKARKSKRSAGRASGEQPSHDSASQKEDLHVSADDGYDGYYDDVLPPDIDRVQEGIDTELIKKVAAVIICVILVISMCVAMLYVL